MSRTKAVTLADIADFVGVSKATVARALSAKGYVADDVRARVELAAARLGYRPNLVARGFRSQRSFTIGHIAQGITENPFFAHVARSVEREALANHYKVFLYNQDSSVEHEREGVERFIERRVDAVIFTYARGAENLELLRRANIPVVQIERDLGGETHTVFVDNAMGAELGMRHLTGLGHRHIAFIGGSTESHPHSFSRPRSVEEERLGAYLKVMAEYGITPDPAMIRLGPYITPGARGENAAGHDAMNALLALPRPPTAVFTGCDVLASGALRAIYAARLRIPDDISVVGFDDTLASVLSPMLTTVAQPMVELGRTAFQFALAAIEDSSIAPQTITLAPHLVIRDSTGAPSGAG